MDVGGCKKIIENYTHHNGLEHTVSIFELIGNRNSIALNLRGICCSKILYGFLSKTVSVLMTLRPLLHALIKFPNYDYGTERNEFYVTWR